MRVICLFFLDEIKSLQSFAESCQRFTPLIAIGERSVFLEIGACRNLYSEKNIQLRLQILLQRFGLNARLSLADDIPTALAFAIYQKNKKNELPTEALQCYATPFFQSNSLADCVHNMKNLGIMQIGDLLKLPKKQLTAKIGKNAYMAFHYLDCALHIPWPKFSVQEIIKESYHVDELHLIRDLNPLLFVARGILDKIMLRLRGQGRLISAFKLSLQQENYSLVKNATREWLVELSFPNGSIRSLLSILQDRMSFTLNREPLESHVNYLEIEVLRTTFGQARQTDFFSKKEEEMESFQAIVSRLIEKLGEEHVFLAEPQTTYTPEKAWKRTLAPIEPIQLNLPIRPLRILRKPQLIKKMDSYFVHPCKKWQIVELSGPERLSGEWWLGEEERDYFRIKTESKEEIWVFLQVGTQNYYLHGIFD